MPKESLKTALFRAAAQWLKKWAETVLEETLPPKASTGEQATGAGETNESHAPPSPDAGSPPPAPAEAWPGGPPAHWLEKVRRGAPGLWRELRLPSRRQEPQSEAFVGAPSHEGTDVLRSRDLRPAHRGHNTSASPSEGPEPETGQDFAPRPSQTPARGPSTTPSPQRRQTAAPRREHERPSAARAVSIGSNRPPQSPTSEESPAGESRETATDSTARGGAAPLGGGSPDGTTRAPSAPPHPAKRWTMFARGRPPAHPPPEDAGRPNPLELEKSTKLVRVDRTEPIASRTLAQSSGGAAVQLRAALAKESTAPSKAASRSAGDCAARSAIEPQGGPWPSLDELEGPPPTQTFGVLRELERRRRLDREQRGE